MNIYHETSHLLDNVPNTLNLFTQAVEKQGEPDWVDEDKQINPDALQHLVIKNDPNYESVKARQTYTDFGASEQWADALANYVAGNINMNRQEGIAMFSFIEVTLEPFIGIP